MVDEEVLLSVRSSAADEMESQMTQRIETQVDKEVANFAGACTGQSMLIFPEEKSLNLVNADDGNVVRLEEDSLEEIGNEGSEHRRSVEKNYCGLTTCHHGSIDTILMRHPTECRPVGQSADQREFARYESFFTLDKLELMMRSCER